MKYVHTISNLTFIFVMIYVNPTYKNEVKKQKNLNVTEQCTQELRTMKKCIKYDTVHLVLTLVHLVKILEVTKYFLDQHKSDRKH